jgi:hypothetical protein
VSAGILHDARREQMLKEGFEVAFIRVSRDVSRRIVAIGYRYVGPPEEAQIAEVPMSSNCRHPRDKVRVSTCGSVPD